MIQNAIERVSLSDVNIDDSFFDSLKEDYAGFAEWFERKRKQQAKAYVLENNGKLQGFLMLKDETEESKMITPQFIRKRRLKISTFKINSHGTVLGQRFLSIIFNHFMDENFQEIYVTLFSKQVGLIRLFERFGFTLWGTKENDELVYIKTRSARGDIYKNFPFIDSTDNSKFLLSILPKFHKELFPDSRLITEKTEPVEDLSFSNTIEKIYITNMAAATAIKANDLLVIYRTGTAGKTAEYSAVATSICTVSDIKQLKDFDSEASFLKYCGKGSIFTEQELKTFWRQRAYPYLIKMLYNIPLKKRIVRHDLIEKIGIPRYENGKLTYFGIVKLTDTIFNNILKEGQVNESFIIDKA